MLHAIIDDILHWQCVIVDRKGRLLSCGEWKSAPISEALYQDAPETCKPGRGAVIALPLCQCGARCFLKADYTIEELYDELQTITDEATGQTVQVLPLRYLWNIQAHWMLYERGEAAHAPVLPMPPMEVVEQLAGVKYSTVAALWFGYSVVREYKPLQLTTRHILRIGG